MCMSLKPAVVGGPAKQATNLGADWFDSDHLKPEELSGRHVFLCPGSDPTETFPSRIAGWRLQGKLKVRSIGFPLYHGIHWHPLAHRPRGGIAWREVQHSIDYWVVHSEQDVRRYRGDRVFFSLLPHSIPTLGSSAGKPLDVFVGGRQNRDFLIVFQAIKQLSKTAVFQSDLLPESIVRRSDDDIEIVQDRVSKRSYIENMSRARIVAIPLETGKPRARGQTDASLALGLGIPIVATRGATVDDYVVSGETGFLVANTKVAWVSAIERVLRDHQEFVDGADARRHLVSWVKFRTEIYAFAESFVGPEW